MSELSPKETGRSWYHCFILPSAVLGLTDYNMCKFCVFWQRRYKLAGCRKDNNLLTVVNLKIIYRFIDLLFISLLACAF